MTRQKRSESTQNCALLMMSLSNFYAQNENVQKLLGVLDGSGSYGNSKISLRLIDWFVTNHAKSSNVMIGSLNVYLSYRSQLKAYSKQLFDPFKRRQRISFWYTASDKIVTTPAQLNFFRWCITNGILDYIDAHEPALNQQMALYHKELSENVAELDTCNQDAGCDNKLDASKLDEEGELNIKASGSSRVSMKACESPKRKDKKSSPHKVDTHTGKSSFTDGAMESPKKASPHKVVSIIRTETTHRLVFD